MKNLTKDYTAATFITIAIFILVSVFSAYLIKFSGYSISFENSEWGSFGSYIGGVSGALLSFVTIVLLALTLKQQTNSSRISQFENSFFELLRMFREIANNIEGEVEPPSSNSRFVPATYKGVDYLDAMSSYLQNEFEGIISHFKEHPEFDTNQEEIEYYSSLVNNVYSKLYEDKETELGIYFRSLFNILIYIHESEIRNKSKYFSLLQGFLKDSELYVIFYHGISNHTSDTIINIIDEYSFLQNIYPKGKIFNRHFKLFYPRTFQDYSNKPINQLR